MAKLKVELKYRKKVTFEVVDNNICRKWDRYVLVCGLTMFQESESGSMVYMHNPVISEAELPEKWMELETHYINLVKDEPLSKQDVRFTR